MLFRPSGDAESIFRAYLSRDCWVMVVKHEISVILVQFMMNVYVALNCN